MAVALFWKWCLKGMWSELGSILLYKRISAVHLGSGGRVGHLVAPGVRPLHAPTRTALLPFSLGLNPAL